MIKKIMNNQQFLACILAFISFIGFYLEEIIPYYNPISWIILLLLILFFQKIKLYQKKYFKPSLIMGFIFAFLFVLGNIAYKLMDNSEILIWKELFSISHLLSIISFGLLFYVLLTNLLPYLFNLKIKEEKQDAKKYFIISFVIIFLCWIPYFLAMYPGLLSPDSMAEMETVIHDFSNISNHHPVLHQIFIWIFYKLGLIFSGDINVAVSFCSIAQMLIMATIFSSLTSFLAKRKVNKIILYIVILSFAILPNHAYYSITMWKDVIFSGLVLLLTTRIITLCDTDFNRHDLTVFAILSLITLLFRNNAIYAYFILVIGMLLIFKKQLKKLSLCFSVVILSYYVITIPLFNALNITKSSSAEYLAIPIQQIARMAYKGVEFNDEEKELLNKLIGVDNLKKLYNPVAVDNIKFNENFNIDVYDENKLEFYRIWFNLVIKNFDIATESYIVSTLGYWYPGVNHWTVIKNIEENDYGIEMTPKGIPIINKGIYYIESRKIPILNMIWSTSLVMWIIIVMSYITIKKKGFKYFAIYLFSIGLWFTMMLATPIYAEYRYIYYLYTTLPVFLLIPYLNNKKETN